MRLLTHNFLQSNVKGTSQGYPLQIEVTELQVEDPPSPVNKELLLRLLGKLNYPTLRQAVDQVAPHVPGGLAAALPETLPSDLITSDLSTNENDKNDEDGDTKPAANDETNDSDKDELIALLHKVLFDLHLIQGQLICPATGRQFSVQDAIPNMLLHADEL